MSNFCLTVSFISWNDNWVFGLFLLLAMMALECWKGTEQRWARVRARAPVILQKEMGWERQRKGTEAHWEDSFVCGALRSLGGSVWGN